MLSVLRKNDEKPIGLAMRVSAKAPYGAKASHKLYPSDLINLHWSIADEKGFVFYSTNNQIDMKKIKRIKKIFLFGNSMNEQFLCSADVESIERRDEEWIPDDALDFSPQEWKDEAKKCWLKLRNFEQIDIDECDYKVLNEDILLKDKILEKRFPICYVDIDIWKNIIA